MQSTIEHLESIVSKAGDLAETKAELWKLKAVGKISETVSSILSKIAIVIFIGTALVILSLGAALWIGQRLQNMYYGFFIVGGFYVLAGIFVYVFRGALIKKPIGNLIIDKIIKE
jgi:phosphoglycerol transferase MdoB-like AlkP superfamily enzyme